MDTNSHLVVGHTSCIDGLEWVFSSSLNTGIRTYYWKEDASILFPSASIALSWEQITCASMYCILCLEADMIVYPEKMYHKCNIYSNLLNIQPIQSVIKKA